VPSCCLPKRLIINADDFGYTAGINRAILECSRSGVVTSATLMASGPAFSDAISSTQGAERLAIGAHIVLLDGAPLTAADIIGREGAFITRSPLALARIARHRTAAAEIEEEAVAQISRIRASGIEIDHLDTHKHTHMFPSVLTPVLRAARTAGVTRVRNPFEPPWALSFSRRSHKRGVQVALLRAALRANFLRSVKQAGMITTSGSIGVTTTGTLDKDLLLHMIKRIPEGTWELVCHPGYADAELQRSRTTLIESREIERQALISPEVRDALKVNGIELISFANL